MKVYEAIADQSFEEPINQLINQICNTFADQVSLL